MKYVINIKGVDENYIPFLDKILDIDQYHFASGKLIGNGNLLVATFYSEKSNAEVKKMLTEIEAEYEFEYIAVKSEGGCYVIKPEGFSELLFEALIEDDSFVDEIEIC